MSAHPPRRWGLGKSLLCLAPLLVGVPFLAYRENYGKSHDLSRHFYVADRHAPPQHFQSPLWTRTSVYDCALALH